MPPHNSAAKDYIHVGGEVWMAATVTVSSSRLQVHSREAGKTSSVVTLPRPSDITFYVGRSRVAFTVSAQTLKHSTYFASLLEKQRVPDPVVLDCDEATFQNMVLILRYGSFEALPAMSDSELFRFKMELECYGIDVPEAPSASSPGGYHRQQQDVFPDLPDELKDASKVFLVARTDDIEKGVRCECTGKDLNTFWALSFHYRHTFCTGCGRCPSSLSPRHLAEMFMAAAMYYSQENNNTVSANHKQRWSVGCDSTCSLKLLSAKPSCVCQACQESSSESSQLPAWAVSTYYSHAFCTRCGEAADERTLIFILLTLRYGGLSKHNSKPSRRDHVEGGDTRQLFANSGSPGSDILRHYRGTRSM